MSIQFYPGKRGPKGVEIIPNLPYLDVSSDNGYFLLEVLGLPQTQCGEVTADEMHARCTTKLGEINDRNREPTIDDDYVEGKLSMLVRIIEKTSPEYIIWS